MADLYLKQAEEYANSRPSYPQELFLFIASKTASHDLSWDIATGNGQAAKSLAGIYKNVIATDCSEKQLQFATKLPNVKYQHTPPTISLVDLEQKVATQGTIDLVTIAQALHWFDLTNLYQQIKWALRKPNGIVAAWCYKKLRVSDAVDAVFDQLYAIDQRPYEHPARELVEKEYRNIDFPFEPVDGAENTGPFEFVTERLMNFDDYLTLIRSGSAYQTAKEKGVELLNDDIVEKFKCAWNEDGCVQKVAKFPVYLRVGRVGDA